MHTQVRNDKPTSCALCFLSFFFEVRASKTDIHEFKNTRRNVRKSGRKEKCKKINKPFRDVLYVCVYSFFCYTYALDVQKKDIHINSRISR